LPVCRNDYRLAEIGLQFAEITSFSFHLTKP
jgi:hypothetical protein